MRRISAGFVALAVAVVVGCGSEKAPSGVDTADATAVMISTGDNTRVAEVSMTIRSAGDDELRSASVDSTFAGAVTVASYAGSSGGDGHLGHLDPETAGTHTHGGRLAIDLPAGRDVRIGPGGVAQIRVRKLLAEPAPGDEFALTLDFETQPSVTVQVTVAG